MVNEEIKSNNHVLKLVPLKNLLPLYHSCSFCHLHLLPSFYTPRPFLSIYLLVSHSLPSFTASPSIHKNIPPPDCYFAHTCSLRRHVFKCIGNAPRKKCLKNSVCMQIY